MEADRIEYYFLVDIWITSQVIMSMRLELLEYIPTPEELVTFFTASVGQPHWNDHTCFMYKTLIEYAKVAIEDFEKLDDGENDEKLSGSDR